MSFFILFFAMLFLSSHASYQIGTGSSDITGPAAEVNFMGYAAPGQTGRGIHLRLHSRAYVVDDGKKRIAFVSIDGGMSSDLLTLKVVEKLQSTLNDKTFTMENVCISGTHSHSGPAGFLQYTLFQVTSWGFVKECFDSWVDGISDSILKANQNLQPGRIFVSQGALQDANINRSPTSYLLNPEEERKQYSDGNTDKNMILLNFIAADDTKLGVLNWFSVHGTSMNNTNRLISGDNRGYASYLLEKDFNGPTSQNLPGKGPFVAAFASTNLGDVSPNTNGPHCQDTGLSCDVLHSTCNGKNELCVASGPGKDMVESTKIIGAKQYDHASELMKDMSTEVKGSVDFKHKFVNMPNLIVNLTSGNVRLCKPSMGYAFAAGTTDGPGMFNFTQGTNSSNPFWNRIAGLLSKPTQEEIACQAPKPILLNTGDIEKPYKWDPHTVPMQIFKIGQVFIANAPTELTTMAGRRLRASLKEIFSKLEKNPIVTIAGLANSYASYTTTFEEYQAQRYEAASTVYGPHQLQGYIQEFSKLAHNMIENETPQSDPAPEDMLDKMISLLPGVITDRAPIGKDYGDVLQDIKANVTRESEVSVVFQAANPRNDQKLGGTFLTVEMTTGDSAWKVVAVDGDWETKFIWEPHSLLTGTNHGKLGESEVTVVWDIPSNAVFGEYRICHSGVHKNIIGHKAPYSGCSSNFFVTQ